MSTDLARVFLDYNRCVRIASGSSVTLCPHGIDVGLLEKVCPLGCWCVSPRLLVCVPAVLVLGFGGGGGEYFWCFDWLIRVGDWFCKELVGRWVRFSATELIVRIRFHQLWRGCWQCELDSAGWPGVELGCAGQCGLCWVWGSVSGV